MKDLRDWYRYLEGISTGSAPASPPPTPGRSPTPKARLVNEVASRQLHSEGGDLSPTGSGARFRPRSTAPRLRQEPLLLDLGAPTPPLRKPGRPPLTETREEIVRRVLDPELTVHEAAALLNMSKATLRRYTDRGKLPCTRTAGGQRRFRLSEILVLLDQGRPMEATR